MADNISVRDSGGTARSLGSKDISNVHHPYQIRTDASANVAPSMDAAARKGFQALTDGTNTVTLVDTDGAIDERTDHYVPTAAALMGTDAAGSAGAKLVPVQVVSTAVPILKTVVYNAAGSATLPGGDSATTPIYTRPTDGTTAVTFQDCDGAIDERLDTYAPVAAALMATDSAAGAGSKLVPVQLVSTAVPILKVVNYNAAGDASTPAGNATTAPVYVTLAPNAANGMSLSTKLAQSGTIAEITDSACVVYSITTTNSHSAAAFLQVFNVDDTGVTVGTTAPDLIIEMPAGVTTTHAWPLGMPFSAGFSIAATTTRRGSTTATADTVDVTITYK